MQYFYTFRKQYDYLFGLIKILISQVYLISYNVIDKYI